VKAYELMFVLDPSLDEDSQSATMDKIQGVITSDGGSVDEVDPWGKRKLAYEVDDHKEGIYNVIQLHASPESIAELDRVLHITDAVIRYMLVRKDEKAS
jgi:small subunit ribosomal protein S6